MNAPENLQDLDRCENLLLGQYTTGLGNQINGIFCDRKSNNIFNGIWRLPSSEIDRPGSFSTHMVKCVSILIQMLVKRNNYKLLIEVGLQLYKTPDNDKRYIKDAERFELYHQSIYFCVQIVWEVLKKNTIIRNNNEILTILIDMYKAYKKCVKYINEKELLLTQLLIDIYKFYIHDKVSNIPENCNFLEIVIKFCSQEINLRKSQGRHNDDSTKSKNLQNICLGINKVSAILEKDLQPKTQFIELLSNYPQINTGKNFSTGQSNPLLIGKYPRSSRSINNSSNFSPVEAFRSATLSNYIGYPNLLAESNKIIEISNEDREKCSSLQQNSSNTNFHQASQIPISEHLSVVPEIKISNYSELKSCDDEDKQTSIKQCEIPTTVYSDRLGENKSTLTRQNVKEEPKPLLISETLNSSGSLSYNDDGTALVSSEIKYYPNFQKTKSVGSCMQNLEFNYKNESVPYTNLAFETILNSPYNSPECNKSEEKVIKSKVNISSNQVKNLLKPYNRETNNPSLFLNNQYPVRTTYSKKSIKSPSSLGVSQKDTHMDPQKEYSLESNLNHNIYKTFSNDKLTMHSVLACNNPTTKQSELISSKKSSSVITTISDISRLSGITMTTENANKHFNYGVQITSSACTSSHETAFADALKLSPANALQQSLESRQKYKEPNDTGFCEAPSTNITNAMDVIILD